MLTHVQSQKLNHLFRVLDLDKNGILEEKDFIKVAENICIALKHTPDHPDCQEVMKKCKAMYKLFSIHVTNKESASISQDDWLSYFDHMVNNQEDEFLLSDFIDLTIENVFDIFDQNKDGSITINEYVDMFKVYGIDINYTSKGFEHLDIDKNHKISKQELEHALREFFTSKSASAKGNWVFGSWT